MEYNTINIIGLILLLVVICIFAIVLTFFIMYLHYSSKIEPEDTKIINLQNNAQIRAIDTDFYGFPVSTIYKKKQYTQYILYGDFDQTTDNPAITIAYSDDGEKFHISGDTTWATFTNTNNGKTQFLSNYSNKASFKFITVYVKGKAENFNCKIKLNI